MKKYISILLVIVAILSVCACYDLDRYPEDKINTNTFWKTQQHAEQGINAIYAMFQNYYIFGSYFSLDCLGEVGTGYGEHGNENISRGTYNSLDNRILNRWTYLYEGVARANLAIQNIPKIHATDSEIATLMGEAKFLRSLFYFYLTDFFGGVPIYDEKTIVSEDFANMLNPRSSIDEVRKFILKDLDDAIATLPTDRSSDAKGRVTQNGAYALKGKVLLYAKRYAEAATVFEEVINSKKHTLYSSYENLFKPGGDESSEMIFAVQNLGGLGQDIGIPSTFYMGTRASFGGCWNNVMASTSLVDSYEWKDGRAFNWEEVIPDFTVDKKIKDKTFRAPLSSDKKKVTKYPSTKQILLDMYEQRDPRMKMSIILPYTTYKGWVSNANKICEFVVAKGAHESNGMIRHNGSMTDSYLFRKFVAEGDMNGAINNREDTPINFPIIRYADVLLMLAECYNEINRQDEAVTLINQVRKRVKMPGINSGPEWLKADNKEEIFKRIRHERMVEFAAEGLNFSDMKRWGVLEELNNKQETGFTGVVYYTRKVSERDYLWPIPATEIDKNPNLKQNPGWGN